MFRQTKGILRTLEAHFRYRIAERIIEIRDLRHRNVAVAAAQINIEFQQCKAQVILHGFALYADMVPFFFAFRAVVINL